MSEVAVVTGAAQGIGAAVSQRLLAEGYTVVSADVEAGREPFGPGEHLRHCDVTAREQVHDALRYARELGVVRVAVCCAGYLDYQPVLDLADETWQRTIDVDLTGVFRTAQEAARLMRDDGGGSIVVITSISAELPSRTQGHYAAAKAGAAMLVQAMAWELAEYRIRVNAVAPGWVETRMTADYLSDPQLRGAVERTIPLGRVAQPSDIAAAVSLLCDQRASYITGVSLRVDGGLIIGQDKT